MNNTSAFKPCLKPIVKPTAANIPNLDDIKVVIEKSHINEDIGPIIELTTFDNPPIDVGNTNTCPNPLKSLNQTLLYIQIHWMISSYPPSHPWILLSKVVYLPQNSRSLQNPYFYVF